MLVGIEEQDVDRIPYNNTGVLNGMVDKKFTLAAKVTYEEEEGERFFVLHGRQAKLKVADPSNGTGLFLKYLVENNYLFEGGVIMTEVEPFGSRRKSRVAGTVEVQFLNFGNRVVTG